MVVMAVIDVIYINIRFRNAGILPVHVVVGVNTFNKFFMIV
jgi:hypothetical protein